MLKIPEQVLIRGRVWTVTRPEAIEGDPDAWGRSMRAKRSIEVLAGLPEDQAALTFIHECMHATFPQCIVKASKEEAIVENMDEGMLDVVLALLAA